MADAPMQLEKKPEPAAPKAEGKGDDGAHSPSANGQKQLQENKDVAKSETNTKERQLAAEIDKGNVPALVIEHKVTDQDEQSRLHRLQAGLLADLSYITAGSKKQDCGKINKEAEELKKEFDAKTFGPATQALYKRLIDIVTKEVGAEVRQLSELKLPLPPGAPIDGKHSARDKARVDLKLNTSAIPSWEDFDRLDNLKDWRDTTQRAIGEGSRNKQDQAIQEAIQKGHLPPAWGEHQKYNSDAWRLCSTDAIMLTQAFGSYVQVADLLNKMDIDPPIKLPPLTEIKRTADGQIENINLGLPTHLDLANPNTAARFHEMQSWLQENAAQVDKAFGALQKYVNDKDSLVLWGETELKHGKARFDDKGNFLGVAVDGKYKPIAGEHLADCNLLDTKFDVIHKPDGKIEVRQSIQAEHAPFFSYHNTIGVQKLGNGKPRELESRTYEPDDYVPVKGLSGLKLIKAKDLDTYKAESISLETAGKTVPMVMDAAMVVSGAIEVRAAVGLIQLAKMTGEQAITIGLKEAYWEAAKATTKTIVGLMGAMDSAAAKETRLGANLNNLRNDYFLLDTGKGLIQGTWRKFRSAEELGSSEKLQLFITGGDVGGAKIESALPALKTPFKITERAFKFTEYGMAPLIATGLGSALSKTVDIRADRRLEDIFRLYGNGGQGLAFFEDENNPITARSFGQGLDAYAKALTAESPNSKAAEMFAKTASVIQSGDANRREKLKQELLQTVAANFFSKQELTNLDTAYRGYGNREMHPERKPLTSDQLFELLDPKDREKYRGLTSPNPADRARLYSENLEHFDSPERMAALICLAYISKGHDNELPSQLGSFQLRDGKAGTDRYELGQKMEVSIDQSHLVKLIASSIEKNNISPSERAVASDFLLSVGAIGARQYAAISRQILDDPRSSHDLKIALLAGNGLHGFAANIRTIESHSKPPSTQEELEQTSGVSVAELQDYLRNLAKTDKSKDVRALAAAEYFASVQANDRAGSVQASLSNTCLTLAHQEDGKLGNAIDNWLSGYVQKKDDPTQPAALVALSLATGKEGRQFNSTIFDAQSQILDKPESAFTLPYTMDPERFRSLQHDNPAAAARFCEEALKVISVPDANSKDTQGQEAARINLIHSLASLFAQVDTPYKKQLIERLNSLIDPGTVTARSKDYALYYPKLREAAIEALSELDARGSEKLVIQQLNPGSEMSEVVGSDARVRLAAMRYLEKIDRTALARLNMQVLQTEHDSAVLNELTAFSCTTKCRP
jgi:hypothetical protein